MTDHPPASARETEEISAILKTFSSPGERTQDIYGLLENQFIVVYSRAQSLIQVAGVVITVTGFSGRIIADTNVLAQALLIGGLSLVASAAAMTLLLVMPIRWMSMDLHLPLEEWLLMTIRRRQKKTRAFRMASIVAVVGMALYIAAIAIMLADPTAAELRRVR